MIWDPNFSFGLDSKSYIYKEQIKTVTTIVRTWPRYLTPLCARILNIVRQLNNYNELVPYVDAAYNSLIPYDRMTNLQIGPRYKLKLNFVILKFWIFDCLFSRTLGQIKTNLFHEDFYKTKLNPFIKPI